MRRRPILTAAGLLLVLLILPSCRQKEAGDSSGDTGAPDSPPGPTSEAVVLELNPAAGDIVVEPDTGSLEDGRFLIITFPRDMAAQGRPHKEARSPVVVNPPFPFESFHWLSSRRGALRFYGGNYPVMRTVTLRPGLVDLQGQPVEAEGWGAQFSEDSFGIAGVDFLAPGREPAPPSPDRALGSNQLVQFAFTHDVTPQEVARQVSFMDAVSRETVPVRVAFEQEQPETAQGIVLVEPDRPLPPDREFWLVVERLQSIREGVRLPFLRIYPAGRTESMKATWARGYNQPRRGKYVRIGFSKALSADGIDADKISIEPPVAIAELAVEDKTLVVHGDFQTGAEYRLAVKAGARSSDGLVTDGTGKELKVSIPNRRPAVIFETEHLARQAHQELAVELKTCRTNRLIWQLARVAPENYAVIRDRLREFAEFEYDDEGAAILDPRDGSVRFGTDNLIPGLGESLVAEGTLEGAPGEEEATRTVRIPAGQAAPGLYLLEVSGESADGRRCGNRCLVTLSDVWLRRVNSSEGSFLEVSAFENAEPLEDVEVRSFDSQGTLLETSRSDAQGIAPLPRKAAFGFVTRGVGAVLHSFSGLTEPGWSETASANSRREARMLFITDGDVYQPGEVVRFQAIMREADARGALTVPTERELRVNIFTEVPGFNETEIELVLDESGGGSGSWEIPESTLSGNYYLSLRHGFSHASQRITVSDFRLPDFDIDLHAPLTIGREAGIDISSTRFHGTPNSGAKVRWTAEWIMTDWAQAQEESDSEFESDEGADWSYFNFVDRYSPESSRHGLEGVLAVMKQKTGADGTLTGVAVPASGVVRGEGTLDELGHLKVTSTCPLQPSKHHYRAQVFWVVELITAGGETRREVAQQHLQFEKNLLAAYTNYEAELPRVVFASVGADDTAGEPIPIEIELFRREVIVAKEKLGKHLMRYRNTPTFTSVHKERATAPGSYQIQQEQPGDYVMVAHPVGDERRAVSCQILGYEGAGSSPVLDEFSAELIPDKKSYQVGETAILQIRSPLAGWARATVEAGLVLRELPPVRVKGDGDRIRVPIEAEDFPNVFVRVELTSDPQPGQRPSERIGTSELQVDDPARSLVVDLLPAKRGPYRPGERIEGSVKVSSQDQPVAHALVSVFALDEALLSLGAWSAPIPREVFHPNRRHGVEVARSLGIAWYPITSRRLGQAQKGFVIGGGEYGGGLDSRVRENENPRPLWQTALRTNEEGSVPFQFTAPDALTSYRLVAYAHLPDKFGHAQSRLQVSKPLRVNPYLPRFVREGDSVELRWEVELDASAPIQIDEAIEITGPVTEGATHRSSRSVQPGRPERSVHRITIKPGSAGTDLSVLIKVEGDGGLADATRIHIPVLPAYVLTTEVRSGQLTGGESWVPGQHLQALPEDAVCDVYLSGTRWLPKLANLPEPGSTSPTVADLSSGLLCSLLRPALDSYLPEASDPAHQAAGLREAQRILDQLNGMIIYEPDGGWLPRWPGSEAPDQVTTALVAFCLDLGERATGMHKFPIPATLRLDLTGWRWSILDPFRGRTDVMPFAKCIALLIAAEKDDYQVEPAHLRALVRSLYDFRENLSLEEKALLALAEGRFRNPDRPGKPLPCLTDDQFEKLMREVETQEVPTEFRPATLGTRVRAEAIRLHCLAELGRVGSQTTRQELDRIMTPLLNSSTDLSAQENLWVMLAARSAIDLNPPAEAGARASELDAVPSPNAVTLGWLGHPASDLRKRLDKPIPLAADATWMVRAVHRSPSSEAVAGDGLKLTREIQNLTAPQRTGSADAPVVLGDYVLLNYKVEAAHLVHQLRLQEQLPAALEVINPDLPSVRRKFALDSGDLNLEATLTYANRRDHAVTLYFDQVHPGKGHYAVLTRVAGTGTFVWPAAQCAPLYDKRLRSLTTDRVLHAAER